MQQPQGEFSEETERLRQESEALRQQSQQLLQELRELLRKSVQLRQAIDRQKRRSKTDAGQEMP